jgi:hypothetical protein
MPTLILRPWLSPTRLSLVPKAGREGLATDPGNVSTYFGITGGRDHRDLVAHFHEAHVDQDPEVVRADRY